MKKNILGFTVLALMLSSCGKDNKVVTVPNNGNDANAFTAGILANGGMPQVKDSVRYQQKKNYKAAGNMNCSYIVDTGVVVVSNQNEKIRLRIKNTSVAASRNSSYCPSFHPTLRNNRVSVLSTNDFVEKTTKKIKMALDPAFFCQEKSNWCASAVLLDKKDVVHNNKEALYVEAEFQNRNGRIFRSKSYISKTSLLENVFEYELINVRTGHRLDFKTPKPDRRRRPRR